MNEAVACPPKRGTIGLGVWNRVRKGQKRGLYGWLKTSKRTCDSTPSKAEKTNINEKVHFSLTLFLSIGKNALTNHGYTRTVNATAISVPSVKPPIKL